MSDIKRDIMCSVNHLPNPFKRRRRGLPYRSAWGYNSYPASDLANISPPVHVSDVHVPDVSFSDADSIYLSDSPHTIQCSAASVSDDQIISVTCDDYMPDLFSDVVDSVSVSESDHMISFPDANAPDNQVHFISYHINISHLVPAPVTYVDVHLDVHVVVPAVIVDDNPANLVNVSDVHASILASINGAVSNGICFWCSL